MKTVTILLCLMAFGISTVIGAIVTEARIANGIAISNAQAPYMVLLINNETYCGGSLVKPDIVVTAAHCVYGRNMNVFTVIANITSVYESGITRSVSRMSVHKDYNSTTKHSDIAVLQLNKPIANASTLELCKKPLKESDKIQVSGWGRLGIDKPIPYNLQTVELSVINQKTCANQYAHLDMHNMFCALGLNFKSACKGDSGGPAVFERQLCGIVAFAYGCGEEGFSGAYTDVHAESAFIENFIWENWG